MTDEVEALRGAGNDPKVFGIGLHKTSTSSLANALYTLGYRVGGYFDTSSFEDDNQLREYALGEANRFGAVQDMPWPAFYRLLDERFPGSKFVLTIRDPDRWIKSVVAHFGDRRIASHEYFYGVPTAAGNESAYLERFHRHNEEVRRYFSDRPEDLLVMDIADGDGWPELCALLGTAEPGWEFPRENDGSRRRATRYRRAAESLVRSGARRVGLGERWTQSRTVRALDAYDDVHRMCRRLDIVVQSVDEHEADRATGMVRVWLEELVDWGEAARLRADTNAVRFALGEWRLADAWRLLRLGVRQWTADLGDDGGGVTLPGGESASVEVIDLLGLGHRFWGLIAPELDAAEQS